MEPIVLTEIKTNKLKWGSLMKASQMPTRELYEHFQELSEENPLFAGPICS